MAAAWQRPAQQRRMAPRLTWAAALTFLWSRLSVDALETLTLDDASAFVQGARQASVARSLEVGDDAGTGMLASLSEGMEEFRQLAATPEVEQAMLRLASSAQEGLSKASPLGVRLNTRQRSRPVLRESSHTQEILRGIEEVANASIGRRLAQKPVFATWDKTMQKRMRGLAAELGMVLKMKRVKKAVAEIVPQMELLLQDESLKAAALDLFSEAEAIRRGQADNSLSSAMLANLTNKVSGSSLFHQFMGKMQGMMRLEEVKLQRPDVQKKNASSLLQTHRQEGPYADIEPDVKIDPSKPPSISERLLMRAKEFRKDNVFYTRVQGGARFTVYFPCGMDGPCWFFEVQVLLVRPGIGLPYTGTDGPFFVIAPVGFGVRKKMFKMSSLQALSFHGYYPTPREMWLCLVSKAVAKTGFEVGLQWAEIMPNMGIEKIEMTGSVDFHVSPPFLSNKNSMTRGVTTFVEPMWGVRIEMPAWDERPGALFRFAVSQDDGHSVTMPIRTCEKKSLNPASWRFAVEDRIFRINSFKPQSFIMINFFGDIAEANPWENWVRPKLGGALKIGVLVHLSPKPGVLTTDVKYGDATLDKPPPEEPQPPPVGPEPEDDEIPDYFQIPLDGEPAEEDDLDKLTPVGNKDWDEFPDYIDSVDDSQPAQAKPGVPPQDDGDKNDDGVEDYLQTLEEAR